MSNNTKDSKKDNLDAIGVVLAPLEQQVLSPMEIKKKINLLDRYIKKIEHRIGQHVKALEQEQSLSDKDKKLLNKGLAMYDLKQNKKEA
jgi:hypothetical protein